MLVIVSGSLMLDRLKQHENAHSPMLCTCVVSGKITFSKLVQLEKA